MGRSSYAILAMGLVSTVVLSLLMKYFLKATEEGTRSPVVRELTAAFGERLDRQCEVVLVQRGGDRHATVTVYPMLGTGHDRLARQIGDYVWRRLAEETPLASVTVVCEAWGRDEPSRFEIPRPFLAMPPKSRFSTGTTPSRTDPAPGFAVPDPKPDSSSAPRTEPSAPPEQPAPPQAPSGPTGTPEPSGAPPPLPPLESPEPPR